jgi:hypothetical protein
VWEFLLLLILRETSAYKLIQSTEMLIELASVSAADICIEQLNRKK